MCILQSKLIQAYKMMPQTSEEALMVFISVYQMDPVTEYTGKVVSISCTIKPPQTHTDWPLHHINPSNILLMLTDSQSDTVVASVKPRPPFYQEKLH